MFEGLDNSTEIWDTIVLSFNLIFLEKGITQLSNNIFQNWEMGEIGKFRSIRLQYALNYGLTFTCLKEYCVCLMKHTETTPLVGKELHGNE